MLAHYLSSTLELGVTIDFRTVFTVVPNRGRDPEKGTPAFRWWARPEVPLILCDHGECAPGHQSHPVAFLTRHPLDMLVSYFHQCVEALGIFQGSLTEFLRDPGFGTPRLVRYLEGWAALLDQPQNLVLSYESLLVDPYRGLSTIVRWLGLPHDVPVRDASVQACTLDSMRRIERSGLDEPEKAWRVRRGRAGGHASEMNPDDIAWVRSVLRDRLDPALAQRLGLEGAGTADHSMTDDERTTCATSTEN
jgi:hypothetical protein